jgi:hypothetical protein
MLVFLAGITGTYWLIFCHCISPENRLLVRDFRCFGLTQAGMT